MSKRRRDPSPPPSSAVAPVAAAATAAANAAAAHPASSPSKVRSTIEPLPEQALGRKRARHSSHIFSWIRLLATVEVQLVLRCLDVRSRLAAARCNKQLYAAVSHPFAWPQGQMATLRVENDAAAQQALGARVRGSLLRLAPIRVEVVPLDVLSPLSPEVFAVPNVQSITTALHFTAIPMNFLLPALRHPNAQQLRSLDVSRLFYHRCSSEEVLQLQTLPHLHSLSLGWTASDYMTTLLPLSLLFSLTHLALHLPIAHAPQLYPSLSLCSRLVSLKLSHAVIGTELVHCLAQLPSLQRLQFRHGGVQEQSASAWAALRSLEEIQLDHVAQATRLLSLSVLTSVRTLRLLRWRCRAPTFVPQEDGPIFLPQLAPLTQLLTDAPLLQVELVMQCTFDEWQRASSTFAVSESALANYQRRKWDELHQMPADLPRVRIVELQQEHGMAQS
jgi:hypothetical protein